MRVDIRCRVGTEQPLVTAHTERRLRFALSRFEGRVRTVRVTVEDANGPKGGVDKRCTVVVTGTWTDQPVVTKADAVDWREAVDRACDAAARATARGVARHRISGAARAPGERSERGPAPRDV